MIWDERASRPAGRSREGLRMVVAPDPADSDPVRARAQSSATVSSARPETRPEVPRPVPLVVDVQAAPPTGSAVSREALGASTVRRDLELLHRASFHLTVAGLPAGAAVRPRRPRITAVGGHHEWSLSPPGHTTHRAVTCRRRVSVVTPDAHRRIADASDADPPWSPTASTDSTTRAETSLPPVAHPADTGGRRPLPRT